VLDELTKRGYIYEAVERAGEDGDERSKGQHKAPAKWFRSTEFGDKEDRVVVKSDGSPTYLLPDIAYHVNKLERGFDLLVNLLGSDHLIEHQVVKYGIQALGLDASKIHVIIMQFVNIKGGRMSTRKGEFVALDELIDKTSPDVVRYLLLARNPDSPMDFDLDLAVKQSNENPVYYIQNAHVRCAGIFREAEARGISDDGADLSLLGEAELRFIRKALELGEQLELAAANLEPHKIAIYAHDLASIFHPIYDTVRALHGDVPAKVAKARLRFYRAAQVVFKRVLRLMGMSAPERM
jgi:arginyl-tRNA synthetase